MSCSSTVVRPHRGWPLPAVGVALALALGCAAGPTPRSRSTPPSLASDEAFLAELGERTFRWFWDLAHPTTGLIPDRWPTEDFASIAATGFGLTAYPIGVENGWVTRQAARERTLRTLRFLWSAPQGPQPTGVAGYRGFFYHFLDMASGHRFEDVELSTIDTTLLLAGVLFAGEYFDGDDAEEREIRELAEKLYGRVEWTWAQPNPPAVNHGWRPAGSPRAGFIESDWRGYNESMILYVLALGSPTHPVAPAAWQEWTSRYRWLPFQGYEYVAFAPLFGHQYSHVWIDFRGIQDEFMRGRGIDYFENSRRHTLAQRAWAIANPRGWRGLDENVWGITASDGPADVRRTVDGEERLFFTYAGRGVGADFVNDDGTVAPTAAGGSIAFAPEVVIPALRTMRQRYGEHLWGEYGFLDAFNPTFTFTDVETFHGAVVPGVGWFDTDYLGIDQGTILAMLENHRSDLVWRTMRRSPHLRRGLERAGFRGGWLESAATE